MVAITPRLCSQLFAGGLDALRARFYMFAVHQRALQVDVLAFDGRAVGVRSVVSFQIPSPADVTGF